MRGMSPMAFLLLVAVTSVETRSCSGDTAEILAPPAGSEPGQVFATDDGVRFRVETVVSGLEIPVGAGLCTGRTAVCHRAAWARANHRHRSPHVRAGADAGGCVRPGEAGLLGLALDPAFTSNGLSASVFHGPQPERRCSRTVSAVSESSGRLLEQVVLLDNIPANTIHDGGRLRFGPDGLLYITTGDAANEQLAQDLASYAGKILRINTDGTTPRGNPFSSPIYSHGHRNSQGLDWNPANGELWASEHGATGNDETNVLDGGVNYGWPRIQGAETLPGMREPITFYNPAIAPSGASFYRGQRLPAVYEQSRSSPRCAASCCCGFESIRPRRAGSSPRSACSRDSSDVSATWSTGSRWLPVYFCTNNRDGRGNPRR